MAGQAGEARESFCYHGHIAGDVDAATRDNGEKKRMPMSLDFLLVGAGRGGTSLLAGLLDAHSGVEMGFEEFAVPTLMGKKHRSSSPERILFERCESFRSQCDTMAAKFAPRRYGNKVTTEQVYGLEDHNDANPDARQDVTEYFFDECLRDVPVVFVLRDGRSCVQSKVARTGQPYELACDRWLYSVTVYEYLCTVPTRAHTLRFEDLLQDAEPVVRAICDYLSLPFEPNMLAGTDNRKMRPEYRQSKIDPAKLKKPELAPVHLARIEDGLKRAGYE